MEETLERSKVITLLQELILDIIQENLAYDKRIEMEGLLIITIDVNNDQPLILRLNKTLPNNTQLTEPAPKLRVSADLQNMARQDDDSRYTKLELIKSVSRKRRRLQKSTAKADVLLSKKPVEANGQQHGLQATISGSNSPGPLCLVRSAAAPQQTQDATMNPTLTGPTIAIVPVSHLSSSVLSLDPSTSQAQQPTVVLTGAPQQATGLVQQSNQQDTTPVDSCSQQFPVILTDQNSSNLSGLGHQLSIFPASTTGLQSGSWPIFINTIPSNFSATTSAGSTVNTVSSVDSVVAQDVQTLSVGSGSSIFPEMMSINDDEPVATLTCVRSSSIKPEPRNGTSFSSELPLDTVTVVPSTATLSLTVPHSADLAGSNLDNEMPEKIDQYKTPGSGRTNKGSGSPNRRKMRGRRPKPLSADFTSFSSQNVDQTLSDANASSPASSNALDTTIVKSGKPSKAGRQLSLSQKIDVINQKLQCPNMSLMNLVNYIETKYHIRVAKSTVWYILMNRGRFLPNSPPESSSVHDVNGSSVAENDDQIEDTGDTFVTSEEVPPVNLTVDDAMLATNNALNLNVTEESNEDLPEDLSVR